MMIRDGQKVYMHFLKRLVGICWNLHFSAFLRNNYFHWTKLFPATFKKIPIDLICVEAKVFLCNESTKYCSNTSDLFFCKYIVKVVGLARWNIVDETTFFSHPF